MLAYLPHKFVVLGHSVALPAVVETHDFVGLSQEVVRQLAPVVPPSLLVRRFGGKRPVVKLFTERLGALEFGSREINTAYGTADPPYLLPSERRRQRRLEDSPAVVRHSILAVVWCFSGVASASRPFA